MAKTNIVALAPRRFIRLPELIEQIGLCRSTVYSPIAAGEFPRPMKLSKRAVAWASDDVERWKATRHAA